MLWFKFLLKLNNIKKEEKRHSKMTSEMQLLPNGQCLAGDFRVQTKQGGWEPKLSPN